MRCSTSVIIAVFSAFTSVSAGLSSRQSTDPQESTTLDPRVIATGFANDGQSVPAEGQVASLTSTNNFINFCLTVPDLPITNGKQIQTGSCNPAPIGIIPSVDRMPSAKFTNPKNGGVITADVSFTISMAIQNLQTGFFVNAQENYFAAPQQLNEEGTIIGHSHVVVEQLTSLSQTTPTNPKKFAFFKGLNAAAVDGVLTADVTAGLPAGAYRLCSINTAANHQPAIVPVAQHGSLDDCVYFTAENAGENNDADATEATTTTAAIASTTAAAADTSAADATTTADSGTETKDSAPTPDSTTEPDTTTTAAADTPTTAAADTEAAAADTSTTTATAETNDKHANNANRHKFRSGNNHGRGARALR